VSHQDVDYIQSRITHSSLCPKEIVHLSSVGRSKPIYHASVYGRSGDQVVLDLDGSLNTRLLGFFSAGMKIWILDIDNEYGIDGDNFISRTSYP
jgi:hypothetical protein